MSHHMARGVFQAAVPDKPRSMTLGGVHVVGPMANSSEKYEDGWRVKEYVAKARAFRNVQKLYRERHRHDCEVQVRYAAVDGIPEMKRLMREGN